jgi:hypothetical protein
MRWPATTLLFAAGAALAGCGGKAAPVTGLIVAIDYSGDVARIAVSGAAETTGRRFGPWSLTSDQLASGGTVGFVFAPGDAGMAMICAQTFDSNDNPRDFDCEMFDVLAGEVTDGSISFGNSTSARANLSAAARRPPSAVAAADSPARSRR